MLESMAAMLRVRRGTFSIRGIAATVGLTENAESKRPRRLAFIFRVLRCFEFAAPSKSFC